MSLLTSLFIFARAVPLFVLLSISVVPASAGDCLDQVVLNLGAVEVRRLAENPAMFFESGLAVDADGAPDAYHPLDLGTDYLRNAGSPGNWRGIVTDTGRPNGKPVVQGPCDP